MTDFLSALFILSASILALVSVALALAIIYFAAKGAFPEDHAHLTKLTKATTAISLLCPFVWCILSNPYMLYDNRNVTASIYAIYSIVWFALWLVSEFTFLVREKIAKKFAYFKLLKSLRIITVGAWGCSLLLGWLFS